MIEISTQNKKVGILTLGCKVNQYESAAIAEKLDKLGYTIAEFSGVCDYYVINTCTVTAEADRKSRQMIRRARGKNPRARVIVTGCLAQINADKLSEIEGVDVIIGSRTKMAVVDKIVELEAAKNRRAEVSVCPLEETGFEHMLLDGRFGGGTEERTRAYVKIEDGCDSHCTYCIIPKARGSVCSKSPEDVVREVENLVSHGFLEVVLTGIETAAYGRDLENYTLADLLEEVNKIKGLERIRLSSLDPSLMRPEFVERISKLERLTPHFHLSLQSGCDRILALMKRKYNIKMLLEYMENIRAHMPDVMFTTDIICGFPGETDEDFAQTAEFVRRAKFLEAHVFAYSKRAGTPAAVMPNQVPSNIASERVKKLYETVHEVKHELLKEYDGRELAVIFEDYKDGAASGHTANFIEVSVACSQKEYESMHGKSKTVKLSVKDGSVTGEVKITNR